VFATQPFETLSGDRTQEFWAEGFTGELVSQVAKKTRVRVISRTSVMRFKDTNTSVTEIARQLGVDAVIEGSVAIFDQKLRIHVQLVDASTDSVLWQRAANGQQPRCPFCRRKLPRQS
jgi:TolB-like protein